MLGAMISQNNFRSFVVLIVMVFLLSAKMRDVLMTKPFALPFDEIGDPGRLIQLCDDIFCVSVGREKDEINRCSSLCHLKCQAAMRGQAGELGMNKISLKVLVKIKDKELRVAGFLSRNIENFTA
uniref:Uncharacterized protein n=1 Tax=Parascaris equorum TaxID=6256 RepID=A0A914RV16_PAREQ